VAKDLTRDLAEDPTRDVAEEVPGPHPRVSNAPAAAEVPPGEGRGTGELGP